MNRCYIDESIYDSLGVVVTALVFADTEFEQQVAGVLKECGIATPAEEFKSGARMDSDQRMRSARERLIDLAGCRSKIAVVVAPFSRPRLGRQTLQAVQSVLIRNGIEPACLSIYFDQEIFPSDEEAARLHRLFHYLVDCRLHAMEDSRRRVGIQVADAVAHSFGQIIKSSLSGREKQVEFYPNRAEVPLGWALLMSLRPALLTRPVVYNGGEYAPECDPVILDPQHDDPVKFGQHPILLGWGVQVAPESSVELRQVVEGRLGRLWLGCIH